MPTITSHTIDVTFDPLSKTITVPDSFNVGRDTIATLTWQLTGAKFDATAGLQWKTDESAGTFKRLNDTRWMLRDDNTKIHFDKQHFPYSITVVASDGTSVTLDPEVVNDPTGGPVPPPRPRPRSKAKATSASKSPARKKQASKTPRRKTRPAPAPGRKKTR